MRLGLTLHSVRLVLPSSIPRLLHISSVSVPPTLVQTAITLQLDCSSSPLHGLQPGQPPFPGEQQEGLFRIITQTLSVLSLFQTSWLPLQGESQLSHYFSPDLLCSKHASFFSVPQVHQADFCLRAFVLAVFSCSYTADICSSTSF